DERALRKFLAATLQSRFRFIRLDKDVSKHFAADAEHGIVEDALLRRLADVSGQADDEHDVHGGLVIADDDPGLCEGLGRNVLKFEFPEGHPFDDASRHTTCRAAQVIVGRPGPKNFQDGPQYVIEKDLAAAQMQKDPTAAEDMPPPRRAT